MQEEQSVLVTTTITTWKVPEGASQAGTPEISKETDSTVSDTAGPLTPDQGNDGQASLHPVKADA